MGGALVLCYHAVSELWPAPLSVTPQRLREQIGLLVARGLRGVPFAEVALGEAARGTFAVTFDDAYTSVLERARPILDDLGVPGTVFVPTAWVGREQPMAWPGIDQWLGTEHESELRCMSWAQLRELADAGWEVGSHTRTHPRLTQLGDDPVAEELLRSREECEQGLGRPCPTLAYPYGDWDGRVAAAAGAAGYSAAATLPAGLHAERPLSWPRVGVYHGDAGWRFRLKASPLVRRARSGRGWSALSRLR